MFDGLGLMRERAFFFGFFVVFFNSFAVFSVDDCNAVDVLVARGDPAVMYLPPQITVFRIRHITYYGAPKLSTVTTVAGGGRKKRKSCSPFAFTHTHTHTEWTMNTPYSVIGSAHWTMNPSLLSSTMSDNDHIQPPLIALFFFFMTYMSINMARMKHFSPRILRIWSAVHVRGDGNPRHMLHMCTVPAGHLICEVKGCGFFFFFFLLLSAPEKGRNAPYVVLCKQHLVKLFRCKAECTPRLSFRHICRVIRKKTTCIFNKITPFPRLCLVPPNMQIQ